MNKTKFFELLTRIARHHNARADEIEIYTLEESEERQAKLLAIAGRREWAFHLVGVKVKCWYIEAQDANSTEKMLANEVKARRWLAEWLEQNGERINAEADAHEAAERHAAADLTALRTSCAAQPKKAASFQSMTPAAWFQCSKRRRGGVFIKH